VLDGILKVEFAIGEPSASNKEYRISKGRFFAALRMTKTMDSCLRRNDRGESRIRHRRTFGIEQGIMNIEGRFFAALRMTPYQITAKAYLVRGKRKNGFPLARE